MRPITAKEGANNPTDKLFAPRYWPAWIGIGLLRLVHTLPYNIQLTLGRTLGHLFGKIAQRRARIAQRNLELCFPELGDKERESLLQRHFEAMGMAIIESAMSWWGSDRQIQSLAKIDGIEHLQQALDTGKGVILLTGHFTSMELAGHILSSHRQIGAMYRPMKNRLMEYIVGNARCRRLSPVFPRNEIRTMAKGLREGHAIWYGYDQNYGGSHSLFIPFFGVSASTITTTSRFARMGNAVVIPFFPFRNSAGRYQIEIHPPLEAFPSGDLEADTQRLNALLEEAIRRAPEQYLWIHRRFKTRPLGQPSVY